MALDRQLLQILVDPDDKGSLWYFPDEDGLYNSRSKRRYAVHDGRIPVLLTDDAESVGEEEHQRLMAKVSTDGLVATGSGDES